MVKGDIEDRRKEVMELLNQGTNAKLLRAGTDQALKYIQCAYRLANQLPAPWPQLTAYRLAHLLLRKPVVDLEEVDSLLQEANLSDHLGPVPRIFRLVVLHRMLKGDTKREKKRFLIRQIREVHTRAVESVMHHLHKADVQEDEQDPSERAPLQGSVANLLELATYFLELDYTLLEGLGGPFSDLNLGEDSWFLVGSTPSMATIRYPHQLAEAELKDRGTANPGAVLFRLCPDNTVWKGSEDWKQATEEDIHLLAHLLVPEREGQRLIDRVLGDSLGDDLRRREDRFRQIITRFRRKMSLLAEIPVDEVLTYHQPTRDYRLSPELKVFGIVHRRTFAMGPSNR